MRLWYRANIWLLQMNSAPPCRRHVQMGYFQLEMKSNSRSAFHRVLLGHKFLAVIFTPNSRTAFHFWNNGLFQINSAIPGRHVKMGHFQLEVRMKFTSRSVFHRVFAVTWVPAVIPEWEREGWVVGLVEFIWNSPCGICITAEKGNSWCYNGCACLCFCLWYS